MYRHRVGKHIAGHPLSYHYDVHPTVRSTLRPGDTGTLDRVASEPLTPVMDIGLQDLPNLRKPQTFPATHSNHTSPISPLDLPPLTPPELGPQSNADLENQSTRSSQKPLHWYNRKRKGNKAPRQHSEATARAHMKTPFQLFKEIILSSYANFLLVFIPVGIALHFVPHVNPTIVFVMNFLAIVPLAGLLSFATEEIAIKVGQVLGGLMNATFGNAVELIVSIIALIQGKVVIVQASLLGSMLSNLLLVLGMCFFFGGLRHKEQEFNMTAAQTASSLLALAISSLLIPAAFQASVGSTTPISTDGVLSISRGTAVILLVVYGMYLYFQLKSHAEFYEDVAKEEINAAQEHATITPWWAVGLLVVSTVLVAICAEFLVDSIDGMVEGSGISETFVGLILLPIVGNAAEHVTAVTVAIKNKMDLAIGVAVGSSMQIALLVTPLMVLLGWIIGSDMSLFFNTFETAILFITVFIVNYLIQDGKSNYLEGGLLMAVYVIISVAVWFYPSL